jgi:DUF4097 and DUF4098 domain-containing protein YvlB
MRLKTVLLLFVVLAISSLNCNLSVNKTLRIDDGERVRNSLNTVNGSIIIGEDCDVRGDCRTVNGRIEVGRNSKVRDLEIVNGGIRIDRNVEIKGNLSSINGKVDCSRGVRVNGEISTINGAIDLERVIVEDNIETYNGNITLKDKCEVYGDILIKRNKGKSDRRRNLKIRISDNSVVEGDIIVRDDRMKVIVYLSDGGKVKGKIKNAEIVKQ